MSDTASAPVTPPSTAHNRSGPRYNAAEKAWLKRNFEDEFHFLRSYGLSIYKEEDRDEGKAIFQALTDSSNSDPSEADYDDADLDAEAEDDEDELFEEDGADLDAEAEDDDFLKDLEMDPMSHSADRHFSEARLDAIKKHFRHAGNFLPNHGLQPYDDDDCRAGRQIAADMVVYELTTSTINVRAGE